MQEDVRNLRAIVTMKIVSITLLLSMPMGAALNRMTLKIEEGHQIAKDAEDATIQARDKITSELSDIRHAIHHQKAEMVS